MESNSIDTLCEECNELIREFFSINEKLFPEIEKLESTIRTQTNAFDAISRERIEGLTKKADIADNHLQKITQKYNEIIAAVTEFKSLQQQITNEKKEINRLTEENRALKNTIKHSQTAFEERILMLESSVAELKNSILKITATNQSYETVKVKGSIQRLLDYSNGQLPIDIRQTGWPEGTHFKVTTTKGTYAHGTMFSNDIEQQEGAYPLERAGYEYEFYQSI